MADYISQFTGGEIDRRLAKVSELEAGKQDKLVSGETIKTVGGQSILGEGNIPLTDKEAVKFTPQTLTDAQKAQALTNIGAASEDEVAALADQKYEGPYATTDALPTASASTMGAIYLVGPDSNGEYDRYVTKLNGNTYTWGSLGKTSIDLANYATKAEVGELEAEVTDLEGAFDIEQIVSPNLLDMSKCVPGYYWTNGHNDSTSYQYTDYIPVEEGETYTLQSSSGGTRSLKVMRFIVFFDESKTMLESGHISSSPTSVVIPEAAAYMIVTFTSSITISNSPAIVKNSQVVPYVAYFDPYNDLHLKGETLGEGIIQEQMLGNWVVGGNKVKTDAISFDKVSFKQSKNLLNTNDPDVMLGYSQYGPTPTENSNYNLTGYIPVESGVPYTFSFRGEGNKRTGTNIRFISYFSEDKVYLSYEGLKETFTPPVNAKYARLSISTSVWSTGQVERGRYIGNYFPYSPQIEASLIPTYTPTLILPRKVYILDGYENNIYFKNVFNFLSPLFHVNMVSTGWKQRERCIRTSSTENPCDIQIVKNDGTFEILARDQFATVKGLPSTNHGQLVVNCIGDSFTYNGGWFNQMNVLCPSLSFVGMRKSYSTDESLRAEGRGGWTLQSYMERAKGGNWYDGFSPFIHPDGYKYYGVCEFWAAIVNGTIGSHTYELNGFDDFASWFGTDGKKLNPSENDMMYDATNSKYIYWNGSAWADYSGTPTFVFDYAKYIETWGITPPDVVVIMLGVNDFFSEFTEELADAWVANMNTVIQSIQAYASANNKTIKIAICTNNTIASLPNSSYGKSPVKNSLNLWWGRRNCISAFDKQSMEDAKVYVVDTAAVFDPDYGFQTREDKPFAYYEGEHRELYDTNGVHPSAAGYKQLGQCVAAWLQAVR